MIGQSSAPIGWTAAALGELGAWSGGGTPSKSEQAFWREGTIPWVSPKDMKSAVIVDSLDRITETAVENSATKLIPAGSVLFVTRSGILERTLPVARTAVDVTVNQDIKALTPISGVHPDFVAWAVRAFENVILERCSKDGTTVASIDTELLHKFVLPLAPSGEQARIVAAIESYFTRLDDVVTTLRRAQRNLNRYRASVFKAAVEGRLVPTEAELARAEGRYYEPASTFLERLLAERKRSSPSFEGLRVLPEGWAWSTLGDLADVKGGITKGEKQRRSLKYREVPYLRVANVQRAYLDLRVIKTILASEDTIADLRLHRGDVLFNEGGDRDKLGRGWVWKGEISECIHQNHVFRARIIGDAIAPEFLSWYANTEGQRYFFEEGKQTTNLASINMTKLRALPVPVPPRREQCRIVESLEETLPVLDRTLEWIDKECVRCAHLRQSILKWAFEGRLVDQDAAEEPASALLERLRAESAETGSPSSPSQNRDIGRGKLRVGRSRSTNGTWSES